MSRKDILQYPQADAPLQPVRQAKSRMLPLMPEAEQQVEAGEAQKAENKLVRQVGSTLEVERQRQAHAEKIEQQLMAGQAVIEMDASDIDPSFVQDRMEGDINGLIESIREQGQQVPILVRPHPEKLSRYQVAFGHRRLRALRQLGYQVKTIVRDLTDEQLVIAQGQENTERQDLTFIEKARFASRLNARFSREVIAASLSMDKSLLSKMLVLVEALPEALVDAIGPAPGIGRPSWQQMADLFEKASDPKSVTEFAKSRAVQDLPSAERFKAVLQLKTKRPTKALPQIMSTSTGRRLAQVTQSKIKVDISIDRRATPDFAAFVLDQLPGLYEVHMARQKPKTGE